MSNRNVKFVVTAILTLAIATAYLQYAESASTPMEQLKASYSNLPTNLKIGQNVSALNIPLTRVVVSNEGVGSPTYYGDHPVTVYDHNMTLAMYNGTTTNGTLVAVVATNVGTNDVTIDEMNVIGAIKQGVEYTPIIEKEIVGCTQDIPLKQNVVTSFPNGTTISRNVDTIVKCGQTAYHGSIVLKPGESFTTYIVGDMKKGNTPINKFSASIDYAVSGINYMQGIVLPFQTIG